MTKPVESDIESEVEHRHGNSVASLQYARVNKLIISITLHKQKAPINRLSRRKAFKAPKTQQVAGYKSKRKTNGPF